MKRPATKTAPEPTPKSEASLQPAHVRVPDESQPLLKGLIANLLILGVALGVTLPFALNPKTATIGWIIFGIVMLWIIGPYFWLLARMSTITAAWKKLAAEGSNQIIPDTRQNPQAMMNDICRAVPLASIPTAILVPGDEPAIISVGSQVLITEAMYRQTRDHHLQWLLQHEVGHHFAGHISLGALAAAVQAPLSHEGALNMPLQRLAELGLTLPAPPQPLGVYVPAVRTGNLLFLCGQLPLVGGKLPSEFTGKVGASVPVERAQQAARQAALNALAIIHDTIGLQRVKQIVRLTGYVSSASSFTQQPVVLNGASELLAGVFSDAGKHARVAIGVAVLPMDACIEVDIIVEVE